MAVQTQLLRQLADQLVAGIMTGHDWPNSQDVAHAECATDARGGRRAGSDGNEEPRLGRSGRSRQTAGRPRLAPGPWLAIALIANSCSNNSN